MAGYIVYWPQDRVKELQKAGDTGPIKVVLGSIHARMPTIVSVKVGDIVFPVTLIKKRLYVLARLPVERREPALNYLIRELGQAHGALLPEGTALENSINGNSRYWSNIGGKYSYRQQKELPEGTTVITLAQQVEKPHQKHQEPFNCCSQWAVSGEGGSAIRPRPVPEELVPALRFGHPKSKERPLSVNQKGDVLATSLTATRRMSPETLAVFEALFRED